MGVSESENTLIGCSATNHSTRTKTGLIIPSKCPEEMQSIVLSHIYLKKRTKSEKCCKNDK